MLRLPPRFGTVPRVDAREGLAVADAGERVGRCEAESHLVRYNRIHAIAAGASLRGVEMPGEDEALFIVSQKVLNTYTLLLWALSHTGPADEVLVTTYNVNKDIIAALGGLLGEGRVSALSLICSQSIEHRLPERVEELRQVWARHRDRMRVAMCWNHSKITLIRAGGRSVTITGSGNFSHNANIEQYWVSGSPDLYAFTRANLEAQAFAEARMNARHTVWGVDALTTARTGEASDAE